MEKTEFMGKITAGVTHEIKNVLAIIKESAGLLEDLLFLAKDNAPLPREKLQRTLNRIAEQVTRGVDLSTKLNAFAHSSDEISASVEINQAVSQAAHLCKRFARLKEITVEVKPAEKNSTITTDPLLLQMLLFQCMDLLMHLTGPGSTIELRTADSPKGKCVEIAALPGESSVRVTPEKAQSAAGPLLNAVHRTASALEIQVETEDSPLRVRVCFPGRGHGN
jgi:signal transduction histidine kinase